MIEHLAHPTATEPEALTGLWEASVRASHDFLAPEDVAFYRRLVRQEALPTTDLHTLRTSAPDCARWNGFAAFMGIDGDELSMLFVAPNQRGKGLGGKLVNHALTRCGVRRVDVNEQNSQALGFYIRQGFRIAGRDPLDSSSKPYLILHLKRGGNEKRASRIPGNSSCNAAVRPTSPRSAGRRASSRPRFSWECRWS